MLFKDREIKSKLEVNTIVYIELVEGTIRIVYNLKKVELTIYDGNWVSTPDGSSILLPWAIPDGAKITFFFKFMFYGANILREIPGAASPAIVYTVCGTVPGCLGAVAGPFTENKEVRLTLVASYEFHPTTNIIRNGQTIPVHPISFLIGWSPDGGLTENYDDPIGGFVGWFDIYVSTEGMPISFPQCAIATAAFGTPLAQELKTLRRFRDRCLPQPLVNLYYSASPPIARYVRERSSVRRIVREVISTFIHILQEV